MARIAPLVLAGVAAQISLADEPVTFTKDVAPIVYARCASCHRPGEVGPFSLLTYDEVKRHATQIVTVTVRRVMPPWKPERRTGEFEDERVLTDGQIDLIRRWVAQGTPEGNARDLPALPAWSSGWHLGTPDLIVTMPEPYLAPAAAGDVFRTFVIPIPTTAVRYVKALEFQPGNPRVVHHANLGVDRTRSSRRLDLLDPEPGYVGGMVAEARYPEGQLLGWTPGQVPHAAPPGMAWRLDPGSDLVVQLHLQPTGKREPLQVSVGMYFTTEVPVRTPVGLRLGRETIDIPAGESEYVITDTYVLPVDVELLAIQPHAHYLARRMEATATLPDQTTKPLVTIADWDFKWQDVYRYARPLALPGGTALSMRYTYDNSAGNPRNPNHPPRRVQWGQNASDEMGDLWIQMVPQAQGDLTSLLQDVHRKQRVEDLAAYTRLAHIDPANPLRHDAVGMLQFESGDIEQAVEHFQASLRLNPDSAPTHYNLGMALLAERKREDAVEQFREAVRLDPGYAEAYNNLGAMLQSFGRLEEAAEQYRRAIMLWPDNAEAHNNLGRLLSLQGHGAQAVGEFRKALAARADWPVALTGLAWVRATSSDVHVRDAVEAVRLVEQAAALTHDKDATVLDTLAAAYAAAGRFDRAIAAARSAADLATRARSFELAAEIRQRLALYEQERAYVAVPRE